MNGSITAVSDSEDLRIYIDDILHIRIPRDKNLKLQSWVNGKKRLYIIEIRAKKHSERYEYDNKELWIKILGLLDKHI
jgi:hypothetical protein